MGVRKDKLYTTTGEPFCRGCGRAVWDKDELDHTEERMHHDCAEARRVEARRRASLTPAFMRVETEREYYRDLAREWSFLSSSW